MKYSFGFAAVLDKLRDDFIFNIEFKGTLKICGHPSGVGVQEIISQEKYSFPCLSSLFIQSFNCINANRYIISQVV